MESLAFTPAERVLVTADVDLWFEDRTDARIGEAVRRAGGVWIPGNFGMMPPTIGGDILGDRFAGCASAATA